MMDDLELISLSMSFTVGKSNRDLLTNGRLSSGVVSIGVVRPGMKMLGTNMAGRKMTGRNPRLTKAVNQTPRLGDCSGRRTKAKIKVSHGRLQRTLDFQVMTRSY